MASGSITERVRTRKSDGSTYKVWRAQVPDPSRGGSWKVEKQFRTKREAERWLTARLSASDRGEWINPADGARTFSNVAAEWQQTWTDLEPKTQAGYESILSIVEERFGQAKVGALHADALQAYFNELADRRAPNTVRRYFTVVSHVLGLAVERRYLTANPCASVKLPKRRGPKREHLFLLPEEVAALAEAVPAHWRVLVYTAAYTGLRAGELWALRRKRLDVLHGTLRVEEALKEVKGHLIFGRPKSEASRRTVSLPPTIRDMLEKHLSQPAPGGNGPDDLVFTTPSGLPVRQGLFYRRVFKPAVERGTCDGCASEVHSGTRECPLCGSEELRWVLAPAKHGLRFHDLRHTCASLALAVAPNPYAVMKRLGHEDITTTINTYAHLLPDVDAALANALDAMVVTEPTIRPEPVTAIR